MSFNKREIQIFLTFFLIYSFFIHWIGYNEYSSLALTRAIVDEQRFEIDSYANLTTDRSFYSNHYYSDKLPGPAFISLPIYYVWKHLYSIISPQSRTPIIYKFSSHSHGSVVLINEINPGMVIAMARILSIVFSSSLFSALSILVLYKSLKSFTRNEKFIKLITLTYAIGTPTLSYSTVFYYHALQAFFLFLSFYLAYRWLSTGNNRSLLLSGILAGFSLTFSATSIIALLFYVYIIAKSGKVKTSSLFLIGFMIGSSPLLIYNYDIFSNPLDSTYHHRVSGSPRTI